MSIKCGDTIGQQAFSSCVTLTFDLLDQKSITEQGTSRITCKSNLVTVLFKIVFDMSGTCIHSYIVSSRGLARLSVGVDY